MSVAKAFVDTNVLIYAFAENEARKAVKANILLDSLSDRGVGVMSFQVLQEFVNVMRKGRQPLMAIDRCEQIILALASRFEMVRPSTELLSRGLQIQDRYKISWYDSLIVAAAQAAGCELLYSEDLGDGQTYGKVQVSNPFP